MSAIKAGTLVVVRGDSERRVVIVDEDANAIIRPTWAISSKYDGRWPKTSLRKCWFQF